MDGADRNGLSRRVWITTLGGALGAGAVVGVLRIGRTDDGTENDDVAKLNPDITFPGLATNPQLQGDALPNVAVLRLDASTVRLPELAGLPLVVNIWYAACAPCRREMPDFETVHSELRNTVRFIGLNPQDSAEQAKEFADEMGVTYELLLDPGSVAVDALRIGLFPTTLFVTADGVVTSNHAGALTANELREVIQKELLA